MNGDKKTIYFLVALIIILAIILLIRIKTIPKYDPKVYAEVYEEYEDIFGKEDDNYKIDENDTQNTINNNIITQENSTRTTAVETTLSNIENGKVIGKIIIPKINIEYPIIKETTTEYLKVAPTKYCGPEINKIRKSGHSGS